MDGVLLTTCLIRLLSYTTQDHWLMDGPTHRRLNLPTPIINQEKHSEDRPPGQADGGNLSSSFEIPSSQVCLGLCRVDKTTQQKLSRTTHHNLPLISNYVITMRKVILALGS